MPECAAESRFRSGSDRAAEFEQTTEKGPEPDP
jgi:hypothetical protein